MDINACQRWRSHRSSYRPAGETINPSRFEVHLIEERDAKAFVEEHHYSGTFPAARARAGLLRKRPFQRTELVGVAVFSVPMQRKAITRWTGQAPHAGVELGRLVLLDDVEANGESWFVSRATRLMMQQLPDVRALLTYADPIQGHVGTIYQALNYRAVGRSSPRTQTVSTLTGRVVSGRALSKLRLDERGAAYCYDQLRAMGAPSRSSFESGKEYVQRAISEGPFEQRRHPGNYAYAYATNRRDRRLLPQAVPYPKLWRPV